MMKYIFMFLVASVQLATLSAQSNELPWVQVEGKNFVLENGETIVFQAINASDPDRLADEGHWNDEYFEQLKEWGAQMVRFPIHPSAWRKRGKKNYLALLDKGIALAQKNGMYVILDWHSIGNLKTEKYQDESYNTTWKETQNFWKTMAKKYGDDSTVAFFELFNEPTTIGGKLGECSWGEWKLMMEDLISIVRKKKAKNIPLIAGFNWAYDLTPAMRDPVDASGIGYVSHPYPQKREKPWVDKWEKDWGSMANRFPVILTEIGFCAEGERGAHIPVISGPEYVDAILGYASYKGVSFVVWVFDPVWSPMMIEDWTFKPTASGAVWKEAMHNE